MKLTVTMTPSTAKSCCEAHTHSAYTAMSRQVDWGPFSKAFAHDFRFSDAVEVSMNFFRYRKAEALIGNTWCALPIPDGMLVNRGDGDHVPWTYDYRYFLLSLHDTASKKHVLGIYERGVDTWLFRKTIPWTGRWLHQIVPNNILVHWDDDGLYGLSLSTLQVGEYYRLNDPTANILGAHFVAEGDMVLALGVKTERFGKNPQYFVIMFDQKTLKVDRVPVGEGEISDMSSVARRKYEALIPVGDERRVVTVTVK